MHMTSWHGLTCPLGPLGLTENLNVCWLNQLLVCCKQLIYFQKDSTIINRSRSTNMKCRICCCDPIIILQSGWSVLIHLPLASSSTPPAQNGMNKKIISQKQMTTKSSVNSSRLRTISFYKNKVKSPLSASTQLPQQSHQKQSKASPAALPTAGLRRVFQHRTRNICFSSCSNGAQTHRQQRDTTLLKG